jgi:hypothetical protein
MRKLLLILLLVFFLINVSAEIVVELKESYSPRETIIASVDGDVLSTISSSQINLKRDGHIDVAFEHGIIKINGRYYLWLNAPTLTGNYSLVLKNVVTTVNGFVQQIEYRRNLIVSGENINFSIKPGVVVTSSYFEIDAFVYDSKVNEVEVSFPETRTVSLNPGKNKIGFSISNVKGSEFVMIKIGEYMVPALIFGEDVAKGNQSEQDNSTINNCGDGFLDPKEDCDGSNLNDKSCSNMGFYSGSLGCASNCVFDVAKCVLKNNSIADNISSENGKDDNVKKCNPITESCEDGSVIIKEECVGGELFKTENKCSKFNMVDDDKEINEGNFIRGFTFNPRMIDSVVLISEEPKGYIFELINTGNVSLKDITLSYNESLFALTTEAENVLGVNESAKFNLRLRESGNNPVREIIRARSGNDEAIILVKVSYTSKVEDVGTTYLDRKDLPGTSLFYCSEPELDGTICSADEMCSGELADSLDGACCLDKCEKEGAGGNVWIGYLIAGIVILGIIIIFIKYRKTKSGGDPLMKRALGTGRKIP